MHREEIIRSLRANIGKLVDLVIDGTKSTVTILSVGPDGVLCKAAESTSRYSPPEFWIAFEHIDKAHPVG